MLLKLKAHIEAQLGQNPPNLDGVLARFKERKTKRNEWLLQAGQTCTEVYFVVQGCLQVFVYDANENETTRDLVTEGSWCTEITSFGTGKPANEFIRTVEPCQLLVIKQEDFQELLRQVPAFESMYRQILEASYANSVYRLNSFVSMSALDRVKWLRQYRPGLMTRLSSKLIASYLGINKDVYSRLKAKL